MNKAMIFNVQKFSLHDGPGIRTLVFLKGCPLHCKWCSNPESQNTFSELEVFPANCIGCGECIKACPNGAISFGEKGIQIDRKKCEKCGKCAEVCYSETLKIIGKEMTVDEVVKVIKEDEVFYFNSGGGYTFSGGEPLSQGKFCLEVLEKCKNLGYHSTIETCAYGDTELFIKLAKELDLVYCDIKHMDENIHKELTGVSNELILNNIKAIQKVAKEVIIRTPIIPGLNDSEENIINTAKFCTQLSAVQEWELLPYHKLGEHKFISLGRKYELSNIVAPTKERIDELVEIANNILKPSGKECIVDSSGLK